MAPTEFWTRAQARAAYTRCGPLGAPPVALMERMAVAVADVIAAGAPTAPEIVEYVCAAVAGSEGSGARQVMQEYPREVLG